MNFIKQYPHINWWVHNNGWLVLGTDEESDSLLRLIDPSGTCWEDESSDTINKAFEQAEKYLKLYLPNRFPNRFQLD